jgi:hypothetical protein
VFFVVYRSQAGEEPVKNANAFASKKAVQSGLPFVVFI